MMFEHTSVLLHETIDSLGVKPDGIYVDGTLGGGGHAAELLGRLGPEGRLVGIDQDEAAIAAATERLAPYADRVTIVRSNYEDMDRVLDDLGIGRVDGIYLDLGVSSFQFDTAERGFSYREDAPLDMRMDRRQELTAADVIAGYDEEELTRILRDYGEEKYARQIARQIVGCRQTAPIETTGQLTELIKKAVPMKALSAQGHPARRTFQALRIEVNRELEVLENSIDAMIGRLAPGGRLAIITFHSLEDRIVKNRFRENENPCICPPDFPVCVCGRKSKGKVITRRPVTPAAEEIEANRRSRSAKLRVFEAS